MIIAARSTVALLIMKAIIVKIQHVDKIRKIIQAIITDYDSKSRISKVIF